MGERIVDGAKIDRLVLAMAQARLPKDDRFQRNVDAVLFRIRPPALWNEKHAAWTPARAELLEAARVGTSNEMHAYWKDYHAVTSREIGSALQPGEIAALDEAIALPAGKALYERRLAELRAANGDGLFEMDPLPNADRKREAAEAKKRWEAIPAAERAKAQVLLAATPCAPCGRTVSEALERFLAGQSQWLTEVLGNMFGSTDYHLVEAWISAVNTKLAASLPVESKKQVLGTLEMRKDASLAFKFNYYAKDRADGGLHVIEFARGSPYYVEVSALAPGMAAGQSRTLYRDVEGVVSDKP
jgi:hypothetical protein